MLGRKEPEGYAPWGAGPRKCMGITLATAEMRVSPLLPLSVCVAT